MSLPRSKQEQAKRWAVGWATAEARSLRSDQNAPIIVRPNRERYWAGLIRRAGICTPDREHSGLRPSLKHAIDTGCDPVEMADRITMTNTMHLRLRSCTAALWLYTLRTNPRKVRSLGRTYSPSDCAEFFQLSADMANDTGLTLWVFHYAKALLWNYQNTTKKDHASAPMMKALDAVITP